ncbi:hypothetical protein POTOM_041602 [Populus tomentosa]|uniref:Glucosamine/galactosamine-6-phosphate isomerase domain-containing protein n=1 Tax=Populus tomentosa TaxID=118781 RepID=A0A8X8CGM4_POPTO|nr:hypothetical protein POTOM_041602 [Populus tomentosa]
MDATNNKVLEVFDTEELSVSLAKYTAVLSDKFAKERGSFTVVLSGVSLVKSLRLVPKDHPDSNDKLAFDGFLSMVPILPGNAYAINDALMGPDGHVASLFLGHPLLKENQKWVTHITDSPKPPPKRITFTFPVINSSSYIALVVCGAGKADVVQSAVGNGKNSDMLPVQTVSPEGEF